MKSNVEMLRHRLWGILFAALALLLSSTEAAGDEAHDALGSKRGLSLNVVGDRPMRIVGVCHPAPNNNFDGDNVIDPKGSALDYLWMYEHKKVGDYRSVPATVTLLQAPKHGAVRGLTEADRGKFFSDSSGPLDPSDPGYAYLPSEDYLGKDKAIFLVETAGVKVKVVYFFQAVAGAGDVNHYCRKTGYSWKISATLHPDNTSTLTSVDREK